MKSVPLTTIRSTPRQVLVTGGAGFIGTHLCRRLLGRGDTVTIVDNYSTGRPENVEGLRAEFRRPGALRAIEADVRDALPGLRSVEFDEIYHLAATVGVRLVMKDPIKAAETNLECTTAVLRFGIESRHRQGRSPSILLASSSEVYGKSCRLPYSEDDDSVFGPTRVARWSYAQCKALNEHMGLAYHHQYGLAVVIARLFNTVGPGQVGEYGMVLPRFVRAALAGRPLAVHGDGRQVRCFCDARDVTRAMLALVGDSECHGRVFNVGTDRAISIADLADLVIRLTGSLSIKQFVPYESVFGQGFEDPRERRPHLARIRAAIGFEPRWTLEETIIEIAAAMHAEGRPVGLAALAAVARARGRDSDLRRPRESTGDRVRPAAPVGFGLGAALPRALR